MQSPEAMHREALCASDSAKAESCHMPQLSSVGREEIAEIHKAFFFPLLSFAPFQVSSYAKCH